MKRFFVGLIALLFLIPFTVNAAPTITESGAFIEVSEIDADFTYTASCTLTGLDGKGARMDWIMFIPGAAWGTGTLECYVTIKDGSDSGPIMYYSQACDLGTDWSPQPVYYNGARVRPVIDFSVSSVGHDSSKVIFKLWTGK